MKPIRAIEVLIWGKQVGAVAPDLQLGCYAFEYSPAWKRNGVELAPLTMALEDRRDVEHPGGPVAYVEAWLDAMAESKALRRTDYSLLYRPAFDLEPRIAHLDAEVFGLLASRDAAAVIVREDNDRTPRRRGLNTRPHEQ